MVSLVLPLVLVLAAREAGASTRARHAPCPNASAWRDGIPVVQCSRSPPCVEETWTTPERCATLQLDSSWPTWDPWIARSPHWTSARQLLHTHLRGKHLMLVGDSVMRQSFNGLLCEVARQRVTLSEGGGDRVRQWRARYEARQESQGWLAPSRIWHVGSTDPIRALKGWGTPNAYDTAGMLEAGAGGVVVVNYGLHYGTKVELYKEDMGRLFASLGEFNGARRGLAIFRETCAQAFYRSGSYTRGAEKVTTQCAPTGAHEAAHNTVVSLNEVVRQLGLVHGVPILGFYNLTLPRWNMRHEKLCQVPAMRTSADPERECGGGACTAGCNTDCTHLCMTPTLWAAHFSELAQVVESNGW